MLRRFRRAILFSDDAAAGKALLRKDVLDNLIPEYVGAHDALFAELDLYIVSLHRVKFAFRSPRWKALLDQFHLGIGDCTFRDGDGLPHSFIGSHELSAHIRSTGKRFPREEAVFSRRHAAH